MCDKIVKIDVCYSLCSQLIYGGYVSDSYDQQALNAMVDYWVSPLAVKKDFELSRGKKVGHGCYVRYLVMVVMLSCLNPKPTVKI